MLDKSTIDTIAQALDAAEKTRTRIRPPSVQYEGFTTEDAYGGWQFVVALQAAGAAPSAAPKRQAAE